MEITLKNKEGLWEFQLLFPLTYLDVYFQGNICLRIMFIWLFIFFIFLRQALDSQEEKQWYWFLLKSCSFPWKSLSKLSNRNHLPRQRLQFPYHLAVVGQNALPCKRSVNLGESGFPQDHLSNIIFHPSASRVSYSNLIVFFTLPRRIQAYSYSMIIVFLFPCLEHFFQVFTCLTSLCNSGHWTNVTTLERHSLTILCNIK